MFSKTTHFLSTSLSSSVFPFAPALAFVVLAPVTRALLAVGGASISPSEPPLLLSSPELREREVRPLVVRVSLSSR